MPCCASWRADQAARPLQAMALHQVLEDDHLEEQIAEAAAALAAGALVAFPTETVYGLGADIRDRQAVLRLYQVKGRSRAKPFAIIVPDADTPVPYLADLPDHARELMDAFWPGPLTIVLPRSPAVPDEVVAGGPTVGLRCPSHPVPLALARALQAPIAAPSANLSGGPAPATALHVLEQLGPYIDRVLEGGPAPAGTPSTVVDATSLPLRILRAGVLSVQAIRDRLGLPVIDGETDRDAGTTG